MSHPIIRPPRFPLLRGFCLLLLLALACNFNPTGDPEPTATLTAVAIRDEPAATATHTPPPLPVAVSALEDVQSAVVQIVSEGSFVDPYEGQQLNSFGAGTGFFISETGLIVTNNHVVTGAAIIWVQIDGEASRRNARVLGVSECSDLAVLQVERRGDETFPFLEWYAGPVETGMNIYAAGYPLGDPEFTLTNGVVSKASANGDSVWASVALVLEHDATLNPGNSGGPLITAEARVVGVNYAAITSNSQYFAIATSEVQELLPDLIAETDIDAIGINGTVYFSDDNEPMGIWVASVESGSPADRAGIEPGDLARKLEGLQLATDGTMSSYCNILRTNRSDDVLSIEVWRITAAAVIACVGQINGPPLECEQPPTPTATATVPPTATATPRVTNTPVATATPLPTETPASIRGSLLSSMQVARNNMVQFGGLIDQAVNSGSIDCNVVVNLYDTISRSPTYSTAGEGATVVNAYNAYRSAIATFTEGARDMTQNCRDFLASGGAGSIPFQQWGFARQQVNVALDIINPAIQSLGGQ